jgi:hypothetical protein
MAAVAAPASAADLDLAQDHVRLRLRRRPCFGVRDGDGMPYYPLVPIARPRDGLPIELNPL